MNIAPGDAVLTRFGVGVVVRCFYDDDVVSRNSHQRKRKIHPRQPEQNNEQAGPEPARTAKWVSVRLWRQPGKSVASCATATLRLEEGVFIRKLVAAPGMIVRASPPPSLQTLAQDAVDDRDDTNSSNEEDHKFYLIERYLPSKDIYLASLLDHDDNGNHGQRGSTRRTKDHIHSLAKSLAVMSISTPDLSSIHEGKIDNQGNNLSLNKTYQQLHPYQMCSSSTSAKFYPILDELIARGEAAWNLAYGMKDNVSSMATKLSSAVTVTTADGEAVDAAKLLADTSKASLETISKKMDSVAHLEDNGNLTAQSGIANITAKEALSTATSAAMDVTSTAIPEVSKLSLPQTEVISQVYNMLRDDDLTELFLRGKERLQQLVGEEIPIRTKKALDDMGIELDDDDDIDGMETNCANELKSGVENGQRAARKGVGTLRKEALSSLNKILKMDTSGDGSIVLQTNINSDGGGAVLQINPLDPMLPSANGKQTAQEQFAQMFDHFSTAATSDPQLLQIFTAVSDRTKSWQEMTGRLLRTKTASLFMEGSQRLKARAADILNTGQGQLRNALGTDEFGGSSKELTRAFTEGDIAIAKLKSIEMGDAIRSRLFAAIELRSESRGGLDAIIAGSLATLQLKGNGYGNKVGKLLGHKRLDDLSLSSVAGRVSEDTIQSTITNLQNTATSTMKGTKESLIALLSRRSGVRDAILLRLEQVFLDLESSLGREMSGETIANLASGEGGSLALFQPIASKAGKEIESQLDLAEAKMKESKHWNSKADALIANIRQITRGEMSMVDVLDMAAGYLDDETVVAKSGGLIVKAESLLDDFEAASARLGETAGSASKLQDQEVGIMDAVAKAGITKETVMKGVEGLDVNKLLDNTQNAMTDELARRELVSSAGDAALDFLLRILPSMPVPPFDGVREGLVYHLSNLSMAGFKVKKEDIFIEIAGIQAAAQSEAGLQQGAVKASELLIIDVKNISATLDDAVWSFEQTYMPYLKGSGKANTKLWDGAIRLKFELRRRLVNATEVDPVTGQPVNATWEPVLCLNDRTCSIGGIELTIQGESRITWVANKLVSVLKNPLRDYVVSVIINALKNNSGWLIDTLNHNLGNYWDFILRTANLELEKLPKLLKHHVTKAELIEDDEMVELVWRERVPLGLNILTNHSSGTLKVIDFPRGTQARKVAQSKQLDPDVFKGSEIVSVNGRKYGPENQPELFAALKNPERPKAILFKLASQEDLQQLERVVARGKKNTSPKKDAPKNENKGALVTVVNIAEKGDIGLKFTSHDSFALAVSDFLRDSRNQPFPLEQTGSVFVGDLLSHINGSLVLSPNDEGKKKAMSLFEQIGPNRRPLSLGFVKPYRYNIVLKKNTDTAQTALCGGPSEFLFEEVTSSQEESLNQEEKLVLKDFALTEGAAEAGGVFVGDNLVFVNGIPVGAGCRLLATDQPPKLDEVMNMLEQLSPLALTFARAKANQSSTVKSYMTSSPLSLNVDLAYTFSIAAEDHSHIGCKFVTGMNGVDIVVAHMNGVDGPFKRQMNAAKWSFLGCKLESVDREIVPSYANSQLIVNAMKRRWAANGQLELTFCNEMHRAALCEIKSLNDTSKE